MDVGEGREVSCIAICAAEVSTWGVEDCGWESGGCVVDWLGGCGVG